VWFVLASSAYLTIYMLTKFHVGTLWSRPGKGGYPSFWQGVDLVIALPVSWVPLIADYTRFTRTGRSAFWGAGLGYGLAQAWLFMLGALLVLGRPHANPLDPAGFVGALLALPAGLLAMLILVVDETKEAFANIYSTAVSIQNLSPRLSQRLLSIAIGAVCVTIALVVNLVQYENFLLLLGALFVPLFGVLVAHYYGVRRGRYEPEELYRRGAYWYSAGVNWAGVSAWLLGFLAYNWISPGTVSWWVSAMRRLFHGLLGLPFPAGDRYTWLGASLASFIAALIAMLALSLAQRAFSARRREAVRRA
jgi:putative hydroxymethylpyrimidine transporter CytX